MHYAPAQSHIFRLQVQDRRLESQQRLNEPIASANLDRPILGGIQHSCLGPAKAVCGSELLEVSHQDTALGGARFVLALARPRSPRDSSSVATTCSASRAAERGCGMSALITRKMLQGFRFEVSTFRRFDVFLRSACCAIALGGSAQGAGAQTVLLVDDSAASGGDGSSWTAAFNNFQHALDALREFARSR